MTMDTQVPWTALLDNKGPSHKLRDAKRHSQGPCLTWCPTESSDLCAGLGCQGGPDQTSSGGSSVGNPWQDKDHVPSLIANSDPLLISIDLLVGAYGADKVAVYR